MISTEEPLHLHHPTKILAQDKRLDRVLSTLSGLGLVSASQWMMAHGINPEHRWIDLAPSQKLALATFVENHGDQTCPLDVRLKSWHMEATRELMRTKCYRGMRHKLHKRVRGQRTRTTNRVNRILKGFQKKKNRG